MSRAQPWCVHCFHSLIDLHNEKVLEKQLEYDNKLLWLLWFGYGNQCQQIGTQWSQLSLAQQSSRLVYIYVIAVRD